MEADARGEARFEGWVVDPDNPIYACRTCGAEFLYELGEATGLRPWRVRPRAQFEVLVTGRLPVVAHVPMPGCRSRRTCGRGSCPATTSCAANRGYIELQFVQHR